MSDERFASLMETASVIGFALCGFVFVGVMTMAIVAIWYGKKGE